MITTPGNIIVTFEYDHAKTEVKLHSGLIVPERFLIEEDDEDAPAAYGVTTDRRLINPQIIDILSGEHTGKRAFVHYGAFEVAKWLSADRIKDGRAVIPEKMILFFIEPIACVPGTYLGEEVFGELPTTASGIILSTTLETKEGVLIRITHVPENSHELIKPGDIVVTVDQFQYDLLYEGEKYIKLDEREIIGIKTPDGYMSIGNRVLVELLPDPDLADRVAENDKRRAQRDFLDKNHLHVSEQYTRGLDPAYLDVPEPKFTSARLISMGEDVRKDLFEVGNKLLIQRNYGCRLPNNQWILGMDIILGILNE